MPSCPRGRAGDPVRVVECVGALTLADLKADPHPDHVVGVVTVAPGGSWKREGAGEPE